MKKGTLILIAGLVVAFIAYKAYGKLFKTRPEPPMAIDKMKAERMYSEYMAYLTKMEAKYGIGASWPQYDENNLAQMESAINQAGFVITGSGLKAV